MQKYLYHAHVGGYYVTDRPLSEGELYCERCRDEDELVLEYDTTDSVQAVLEPLLWDEVVVPDALADRRPPIICMGIEEAVGLLWDDEAIRAQARHYFEEAMEKMFPAP